MSQLNDLPGTYTRFKVEPYTPNIGAVIHGLDLRQPLDEATQAELRDALARHEVIGGDFGTHRNDPGVIDAEFNQLHARLDLGDRETLALGLGNVLRLGLARAELERDITVAILGAVRHNLATVELENRDRHVFATLGEDSGHPELLCNYP